jgi:hypothetical protein
MTQELLSIPMLVWFTGAVEMPLRTVEEVVLTNFSNVLAVEDLQSRSKVAGYHLHMTPRRCIDLLLGGFQNLLQDQLLVPRRLRPPIDRRIQVTVEVYPRRFDQWME